jgi:hypothetical protein
MRIPVPGNRVKRLRWVHTRQCVVAVEIEMVIPPDDPSEPCLVSETLNFLRELEERARCDDIDWLKQQGRVYKAADAA